ncbi:E3 sumo-protein ligase ranbp2 [Plakobranchus ocellatus]|uniref:Nuclear pore complex protein Nup153 n=1 Tax=Plakobranchus ocellatus TaxID=259542 RepID=A0AAV3ZQ98_9GAST|nr:E3 sumo-protein ligase ranbp2 [Plakobranchus ocellatus]
MHPAGEATPVVTHSTPRPTASSTSHMTNGASRLSTSRAEQNGAGEEHEISSSSDHNELTQVRPRPSPERLDAQLKSVSYSQSSIFKMVLERNDELIMINSKLMEELRDNNRQLKTVLSENQGLMFELKTFFGENRDMMKQIKHELSDLKTGMAQQAAAQPHPPIAPTPPLYLPPHMAGVPPRGPAYPPFPPPAYPQAPGYMINSPMAGPAPPRPPVTVGPQYRPSGLPGAHSSNVGKYRSPSDEDDEEVDPDDLTSAEEAAALYADYCDDAAYSQYFTPDSQMLQDWSSRSAMEGPPPPINMAPPAPMAPRMSIPSPGYFATALRGQSLQYAQNTPPPLQVRPPPLGPGFFSSPLVSTATPATVTSTPSLLTALTGQTTVSASTGLGMPAKEAVKVETTKSPAATSVNLGPTLSGLKSLFQSKGVLEPSKARGDITILVDTNSRRATILMMGDTKDIIFHHDIQGLTVEQTPALTAGIMSIVTWTATKIGAPGERERVSLGLESPAVAAQLREAIQKAISLIQPKSSPVQGVVGTTKVLGIPSATSTPVAAAATTSATSIFSTSPAAATSTSTAKPSFGGFTFSQTPVIGPVTAAEKTKTELNVTATTKTDAPKPFANFSLTPSAPTSTLAPAAKSPLGTSQKSPVATQSGAAGKSPAGAGGGEEDHVEEYEPNVDFKPVIALPELVEKTTGEENETALFVERCRLYRFDTETKQWKERGTGEMKILSSNDQLKFRIIMRRDQIFKLCANHCLSAEMKLTPMPSSDRAWCYTAMDFSDQEMKLEQLAAKFKNTEKATTFKEVFTKCCQQLKDTESGKKVEDKNGGIKEEKTTTSKDTKAPSNEKSSGKDGAVKEGSDKPMSLSELFKPKAGSWECDGCMIRNNAEVVQCPACGTRKPGAEPAPTAAPASSGFSFGGKPGGGSGFSFGSKPGSQGAGFTFGSPATSTAASTVSKSGTGFMFGSPAVTSAASTLPKTGSGFTFGSPAVTSVASTVPKTGTGFTFGSPAVTSAASTVPKTGTGFTFGSPAVTSAASSVSQTGTGFRFGTPTTSAPQKGAWFTFGAPAATTASTTTSQAGSGFTVGTTASTAASATSQSTTGFTFGTPAATTASSSGFNFNLPAATSSATTTSSAGFKFGFAASSSTTSAGTAPATGSGSFTFKPAATAATTTVPSGSSSGFSFKLSTITSGSTPASFGSGTTKPAVFSFAMPATLTTTVTSESKPSSALTPVKCGLLAKLLTEEAEQPGAQPKPAAEAPKPSGGFTFSMPPKSTTSTTSQGASATTSTATSSQGFQFTFTKSPAKPGTSPAKPIVPGSPEVDEHGMYITKEGDDSHIHFEPVVALPEIAERKTGEEDEVILFESRGRMYRFVTGEWKEKGLGVVKILEHKDTKKARVLMRRDQILKVCCNHVIDSNLNLQPMAKTEGKAWIWYAMDFSDEEGKMEQLALRFKTAEIANQFKAVFDKCRESHKASPSKEAAQSRGNTAAVKKELFKADSTTGKDDDVIFVKEEKPTAEQIAEARRFKLPDCFYLYESKPPCPGCIGCTDGESVPGGSAQSPKTANNAAKPVQSPLVSSGSSKFGSSPSNQGAVGKPSSSQPVFGSPATLSQPVFGSSTQQVFGSSASSAKPVFGSASSTQPVFGSAASSTQPVFGSAAPNLPDFSKLTSDSKSGDSSGNGAASESSGFVFGSKATVDFSSLAASGSSGEFMWKKDNSSGPFSFAGAGQKLFGGGGGDQEGGADDGAVAPSDDIHFEPVIPLPDLVEVKTGEEDWTALFSHRSKLYKFDKNLSQWKERGTGDIKIMQHNTRVMFRILQRREQVLKVACNHLISLDMELKPMSSSETAWCWTANDFTESEPQVEQFAVKFKAKETAVEFKSVFEKCQELLKNSAGRDLELSGPASGQGAGSRATTHDRRSLQISGWTR